MILRRQGYGGQGRGSGEREEVAAGFPRDRFDMGREEVDRDYVTVVYQINPGRHRLG